MSGYSNKLGSIIENARNIVFFGGAGVSTESGIPDFRSDTGLYRTVTGAYPPEYMLSHSCFVDHTEEFFEFYSSTMLHPTAQPNRAHRALAALEKQHKLHAVVTQNIDGLHQAAGSETVYELHGSVHRNYCQECRALYPMEYVLHSEGIPRCQRCSGVVKPDVVLYEEPLDDRVLRESVTTISTADVLIIGGTSLNVYPAAGLIRYFTGDNLVLINKTETSADSLASLAIHDSIGAVLGEFA